MCIPLMEYPTFLLVVLFGCVYEYVEIFIMLLLFFIIFYAIHRNKGKKKKAEISYSKKMEFFGFVKRKEKKNDS